MPVCNINNTDRINRTIIGVFLCIGALLKASSLFFGIFGAVMIIEGLVGWCSIPFLMKKFKLKP